jgi:polysaccharide export outer membrane protein
LRFSTIAANRRVCGTGSILGPNDRIRLKVYGGPLPAVRDRQRRSGFDPLAGHIGGGLDGAAARTARSHPRSQRIVRDPRVNVEIAQYRPYYILGEVKKSGSIHIALG